MKNDTLRLIIFSLCMVFGLSSNAQMSGTYSVPTTFTSLAAAINSVSATTPLGPIIIEVAAGYIEQAPFGGYTLTAKGSAATPITFKKNGVGANPLLIAFSGGTNTPATNFQDGVWQLKGSDYITIDGIDILDTNSFNPATMEYGYGLLSASLSGTNGCQYNTIKNCNISLNRINNTFSPGNNMSKDGSVGIEVMVCSTISHTNIITTYSASGTNSFNKFYNNTIQNCNIGIALLGSIGNYFDQFNDVGGTSSATGNKIINYGGAPLAANKAAGVIARGQEDLNITYNTIDNNNGTGVNHPNILFGINFMAPFFTNSTIQNNTVTINGGGTTHSVVAIKNEDDYVGSPTIGGILKLNNNLITNCSYSTATSGNYYGIHNYSQAQNISISNNIFSNNSSACNSGTYCNVYNSSGNGYATTNIFTVGINNNLINNISLTSSSTSVTFNGIICGVSTMSSTTYSASINSNSIQSVNYAGSASGTFSFITAYGGSYLTPLKYLGIQNNQIINLSIPNTGSVNLITSDYTIEKVLVSGNNIGSFTKTSSGNWVRGYYGLSSFPTTATTTVTGNNFSNITTAGATNCKGIDLAPPTPSVRTVFVNTNTVSSISTGSMGTIYGIEVKDPDSMSVINNNFISGINGWVVYGMVVGAGTSSTLKPVTVHSNTICSLIATFNISALSIGAVSNSSAYRNKIYDLQCNGNGDLIGLYIVPTKGRMKIYNNLVGDLRAPLSLNQLAIKGLYAGSSGDTCDVYHNSIYINASSTSAHFGTCGIYHAGSTFTVGILNLKNNLVVNTSTANGIGFTAALQRSPGNLQNYSTASNNNLFYVGGTWPPNKEYEDGTSTSSWVAAQAFISPRESNSKIEFPPFQSVIGSNPNFLNLNFFTPTLAESGGLSGTGVTDDFIGTIRNTTTPDIGAWEGNFMLPLGITQNQKSNNRFLIYPNPNNGIFILEVNSPSKIIITNLLGEEILRQETTNGKNKIDIQNQASGIYFVKIISSENKEPVTGKIIKQ